MLRQNIQIDYINICTDRILSDRQINVLKNLGALIKDIRNHAYKRSIESIIHQKRENGGEKATSFYPINYNSFYEYINKSGMTIHFVKSGKKILQLRRIEIKVENEIIATYNAGRPRNKKANQNPPLEKPDAITISQMPSIETWQTITIDQDYHTYLRDPLPIISNQTASTDNEIKLTLLTLYPNVDLTQDQKEIVIEIEKILKEMVRKHRNFKDTVPMVIRKMKYEDYVLRLSKHDIELKIENFEEEKRQKLKELEVIKISTDQRIAKYLPNVKNHKRELIFSQNTENNRKRKKVSNLTPTTTNIQNMPSQYNNVASQFVPYSQPSDMQYQLELMLDNNGYEQYDHSNNQLTNHVDQNQYSFISGEEFNSISNDSEIILNFSQNDIEPPLQQEYYDEAPQPGTLSFLERCLPDDNDNDCYELPTTQDAQPEHAEENFSQFSMNQSSLPQSPRFYSTTNQFSFFAPDRELDSEQLYQDELQFLDFNV